MEVKYKPAIVNEYRKYCQAIVSAPPEAVQTQGDKVSLTRSLVLETRRNGPNTSRRSLIQGSAVAAQDGVIGRITERYSYDSVFGVEELAWRVDTMYIYHVDGSRGVIDKISTDRVHNELLSKESVDASTSQVLDEYFVDGYQKKVIDACHGCDGT